MDSSNLAARVATLLQSGETGNMQAAKSAIRQHNLVSGLPDESSSQGAILDVIMDLINTDKVESEHEKAWKNCQTPSCITSVYKRITPQPLRRQSAFRNALPCLFRGQTQSAALCWLAQIWRQHHFDRILQIVGSPEVTRDHAPILYYRGVQQSVALTAIEAFHKCLCPPIASARLFRNHQIKLLAWSTRPIY